MCDRVVVMKEGRFVESGTTAEIFANPKLTHIRQTPECLYRGLDEKKKPKPVSLVPEDLKDDQPLLEVKSLRQHFNLGKGNTLKSCERYRLFMALRPGETLGVVGESGERQNPPRGVLFCRLHEPTGGDVLFKGSPLNRLVSFGNENDAARHMQIIFQDPMPR